MARAHEIAENDRRLQEQAQAQAQEQEQEEVQQQDSDSDLSVLASSLFNGMEGVEHDSGTLVEQEGQEERMEGPTEVQIGITGDIQVQRPIFSPRKTRSSRVVKYKDSK
jgi:hypothetical protein